MKKYWKKSEYLDKPKNSVITIILKICIESPYIRTSNLKTQKISKIDIIQKVQIYGYPEI